MPSRQMPRSWRAEAPRVSIRGRHNKPVKVDKALKDGEVVRLGNAALTAHLTPGHTEGNTTWTTTVEEGGKKYDVVFVGSMSINPGVLIVNNAKWPKIDEAYARPLPVLKSCAYC